MNPAVTKKRGEHIARPRWRHSEPRWPRGNVASRGGRDSLRCVPACAVRRPAEHCFPAGRQKLHAGTRMTPPYNPLSHG